MKKMPKMTFGMFKNTISINTKLKVHDKNGEHIGWYKSDQIINCDDYIVDIFWAINDGVMGVQLVKE